MRGFKENINIFKTSYKPLTVAKLAVIFNHSIRGVIRCTNHKNTLYLKRSCISIREKMIFGGKLDGKMLKYPRLVHRASACEGARDTLIPVRDFVKKRAAGETSRGPDTAIQHLRILHQHLVYQLHCKISFGVLNCSPCLPLATHLCVHAPK